MADQPADQEESLIDLATRYGRGWVEQKMREHPVITRGLASAVTDPLDLVQWLATHGIDPEVAMTMTPEQLQAQQDLASSLPNAGELAQKYLKQAGVRESETLPEQIGELGINMLGSGAIAKAPKALSWGKRILGAVDEAAMRGLPRMAGGAERGTIDLGKGPLLGKSGLPIDEASRMKRAEEMGMATDAYHGSPRNIKAFSNKYSSPEGHYGPHHYFTSNIDDVNTNYAGEGPDLTNRIQRELESDQDGYGLQQYIEDQGLNYSDVEDAGDLDLYAQKMAKERLGIENLGAVYPVKLRMKNPVVVGGPKETFFDYNVNVDDAGDFVDESGKAVDLINKTKEAFQEWNVDKYSAQDALEKISERISDGGITASEFDDAIRSSVNDLYDDMSGNMASPGALISDIFQKMGHDSINMDASVFSNRRGFGGVKIPGMVGTEDARHYIVFDPKNIRSRFAEFDPADAESADLLKARGGAVHMGKGGLLKAGAEDLAELAAKYLPKAQKTTSADTSLRQVPALLKKIDTFPGQRNLDIGGGKYDLGKDFLAEQKVESHVYDPFNRTPEHNNFVLSQFAENPADSVTVANVLNVIKEPKAREDVIKMAFENLKPGGKAYFDIYEGSRSGVGKATSKGWQNNAPAVAYEKELKKIFGDNVIRKGSMFVGNKFTSGGAVRKKSGGALSRVNEAGNYTKPGMRKKLFNRIKASAVQGTKAGQWSARKAQLLAKKYKEQGGGYKD